jgi:hypothetical protein
MTLHDQSNIVLIVAYILKGILLFPHYFHQVLSWQKNYGQIDNVLLPQPIPYH